MSDDFSCVSEPAAVSLGDDALSPPQKGPSCSLKKALAAFSFLPVTCHLPLLWVLEHSIFSAVSVFPTSFLNPEEVDDYVIVSQTCPQELRSAIATVSLRLALPG